VKKEARWIEIQYIGL